MTSWTVMSALGCAVGMQTSSDPESGARSVTVAAGAAGGERERGGLLDRSVVPEIGDPPTLHLPSIEDFTRANGLRVILVERSDLPLVSLVLQVRGGASAHGADQAGLAAFTADMLDEGTDTRSALEIARELEHLGATFTSSAGYDASMLFLSVLRPRLAAAVELAADMILRPTFPQEELERVRQERLARAAQRSDRPGAVADDAFARVLYGPEHPYGAPLPGTPASLETLSRDDVVRFHLERYAPEQSTLVVAGDIGREDLDALLDRVFEEWVVRGIDPPAVPPAPARAARAIYLVDRPGASQSEIRVGRVAVDRRGAAYFPITVLNTVLGGSFTSRLNAKLREEKGYTYGAGSRFTMRRAPGPFEASTAVATAVTDSAVADLLGELDRMAEEAVPEVELERAKRFLGLGLPRRFESRDDIVGRLAQLALHEQPLDFYEGYVDRLSEVDSGAVLEAAREFVLSRDVAIVIAGDRAAVEGPLRSLGLGQVIVLEAPSPADED